MESARITCLAQEKKKHNGPNMDKTQTIWQTFAKWSGFKMLSVNMWVWLIEYWPDHDLKDTLFTI